MAGNVGYAKGDNNHATKVKEKDRQWIINMSRWKDDRINRIDEEIENLKAEKEKLKKEYSQKQISFKFGVKPITIRRILKGEVRDNY